MAPWPHARNGSAGSSDRRRRSPAPRLDFRGAGLYGAPLSVEPLSLNVDAIEESGHVFEADLSRAFIDEALLVDPPTEFQAAGPAHVQARVTKLGRKVLFQSRFTVPLSGQCK